MLNTILYEQPLNERVRAFMRLEQLFIQTHEFINSDTKWHARMTMTGLSDILEILNRSDLKTDILKELDRNQINLSKLSNTPGVNTQTLNTTLNELDQSYQQIINIEGQLGQKLREHEILTGLIKRNSLVGSICSFDLPLFHHWLNSNPVERHKNLSELYSSISIIQYAIKLLLSIIRESAIIEDKIAVNGFYQQNLNVKHPYQMIRVLIPNYTDYFVEISAGKHRFSIHFLTTNNENNTRTKQVKEDMPFQLGCCAV
ncbi:MAG: cell division protein ZapD [Thiohalomonadales bacterium]